MTMIPLSQAVMCACGIISDQREVKAERCASCGSQGQFLSLARVLNPNPQLGQVTYVLASHEA